MSGNARLFTIKGRVQGVFFRDSTRREAVELGLTGYAINLPSGDVEVLACGDPDAITQLEAWLRRGPPLSRVESVSSTAAADKELAGFETA
jgi:acylphosphatase